MPEGAALHNLSGAVRDLVEAYEGSTASRTRARKVADQRTFCGLVEVVTANLARAVLRPSPSGALAVRVGKAAQARTRFENPIFGKQLRPLLDHLEALGLVELDVSNRRHEVSNLRPTAKLAGMVRQDGVTLRDFGRHGDEECILLFERVERTNGSTRHRMDYRDSETTHAMRAGVRRLNDSLSAADIRFVPDGQAPEVNDRDRTLARYFLAGPDGEARFDRGGRLYGGWWLNLPAMRRHGIRIDGEPVADLDFSSMFVRLAYAHLGKTPPGGDLYALPGLEDHRSGVKLAINTLFWDSSRGRKSWPKEMGVGVGTDVEAQACPGGPAAAYKGRLPVGWGSVARLKAAILERHEGLGEAFGRDLGATLMFRESEIMMGVLERLAAEGTTALPLHDGIIVPRSKVDRAKAAMMEIAAGMAGGEFPVMEKPVGTPGLTFSPTSFHL